MSVSRQALLNWVNELLDLSYSKVDQLGSGAAYCQIMDAIFLDVPMGRVKFDGQTEYEFQQNYKVLQSVFTRHGIDRTFDTQRLSKCRLQDNLEFLQWIYKFYHEEPRAPYDAASRRSGAPRPVNGNRQSLAPSSNTGPSRQSSATSRTAARPPAVGGRASLAPRNVSGASVSSASTVSNPRSRSTSRTDAGTGLGLQPLQPVAQQHHLQQQQRITNLEAQVEELEHTIAVVTTERTVYYQKLLEIEELVQNQLTSLYGKEGEEETQETLDEEDPHIKVMRSIQEILYAAAEGFETPYRPEDEPF